jgi:DNA repair photolyase
VERLRQALSARSYRCQPIAIGVNTDAYQPAERKLQITRGLLETCLEFRQPVVLITKSTLILRDLDLLAELAARRLARVSVSVTTLNKALKRRLEPRTAGPSARLDTIAQLAGAGVAVSAMVAPVIPRINDNEIEALLAAAARHGASGASYVLLRLPLEVEPLLRNWMEQH